MVANRYAKFETIDLVAPISFMNFRKGNIRCPPRYPFHKPPRISSSRWIDRRRVLTNSATMYADFNGLVDDMMREAKTAKVNIIPLGSHLFVIENTGGNITVLDGPEGKLMVDAGISGSHQQIMAALAGISTNALKEVDQHSLALRPYRRQSVAA